MLRLAASEDSVTSFAAAKQEFDATVAELAPLLRGLGLGKVPYYMVSHTTPHTTLRIIREY
jgi:hypothetical protein